VVIYRILTAVAVPAVTPLESEAAQAREIEIFPTVIVINPREWRE
jgi:hypothetical protein